MRTVFKWFVRTFAILTFMLCSASETLAIPPGIYLVQCKPGAKKAVVYNVLGQEVLSFAYDCGSLGVTIRIVYQGIVAGTPEPTDFSGRATANLISVNEVPSVFSFGSGMFEATVDSAGTSIAWDLTYTDLAGSVTQAHIHFGQEHTNGGVVVFLCSNLGNGPAGTPPCPAPPASISGIFHAADIVAGAQAQGIAPSQFKALLWAMRRGATYVNVHSVRFPAGEIRGQIQF